MGLKISIQNYFGANCQLFANIMMVINLPKILPNCSKTSSIYLMSRYNWLIWPKNAKQKCFFFDLTWNHLGMFMKKNISSKTIFCENFSPKNVE